MEEQQLNQLAKRLGHRAADRLDVDEVASGVVRRLREGVRSPAKPWSSSRVLRVAAVVAIVVGVGWFSGRLLPSDPGVEIEVAVLPELAELSGQELEEILDSLSVAGPAAQGLDVGLYDLDESQLVELLRLMEG